MNGEIIKSYLIALGYKPNEQELKKFDENVKRTEKVVTDLGKSMAQVVISVSAGVEEMSRRLEDFYYVSQRSNTAVSNLMAIRYAAGQVGVGAESITSAIEGLKQTMNLNPGTEGLINNLGIQTRDANHELRDTSQIMNELVSRLTKMGAPGTPGFAVAAQFAQMLGISPETLVMLERHLGEFQKAQDDFRERAGQAGLDVDALSDKSRNFQNHLRLLESDIEIFGMLMEKNFIEPIDWVVQKADSVVQAINQMDRATQGWSTTIISIVGSLAGWKAAIATLRLLAPGLATKIFGEATSSLAPRIVGTALGFATRFAGPAAAFAAGMHPTELNTNEDERFKQLFGNQNAINQNARVNQVVDYFVSKGWSKAQAIGIAANLMRESGFGANAVGDDGKAYGIAQWHADRQEMFKKFAGHDIHGSTLEEQLAFVDHELRNNEKRAGDRLRGATTPGEAAGIVTQYYERPKDPFGASALSGRMADQIVNITQSNQVTVSGVTDPHAAASAVGAETTRNNADLVRNMKSAVQ